MLPLSLRKAITEPGKGDGADRDAEAEFDPADRIDHQERRLGDRRDAGRDAERFGIEESGSADQHRGEADQAVEGGNKLRHRRHLDATRADEADDRTDSDRTEIWARVIQSMFELSNGRSPGR